MNSRALLSLAFALLTVSSQAESPQGQLAAFDAKAGTMTVSGAGGSIQSLRFRPSVEVTLNGARAALTDLAEGMSVKLTLGEPGLASRIAATGLKGGAATTIGASDLAGHLARKRWTFPLDPRDPKAATGAWVEFNEDGSTVAGWHPRRGSWKVTGLRTVEASLSNKPTDVHKIEFNDSVTVARLIKRGGGSETLRLTKP